MAGSRIRFHLTGRVAVEGARVLDQTELGGRQGRLALVRLVLERRRPLPIETLAAALWGDTLPRTWETSLRSVVSRLRGSLATLDPGVTIRSDTGCYQLDVAGAWVDIEAAANAVDRAEGAQRRADRRTAWSEATVAASIAARPVLPAEDATWIDELRASCRILRVRALDVLGEVYLSDGQFPVAAMVAHDLVALEPFRESGHRLLMRAHLLAGERAEALRVHADLRESLIEEFGVEPSPETHALFVEVLRSDAYDAPRGDDG